MEIQIDIHMCSDWEILLWTMRRSSMSIKLTWALISVNCGRIPPKCLQLTHLISMSHSTKTTLVEQASLGHHHAHSLFHCNSISVLWKLPEREILFVWHSFGSNLVSPAHFVIQLMPRHLPRHVGKAICPQCQNYFNYISNRFQYKITWFSNILHKQTNSKEELWDTTFMW